MKKKNVEYEVRPIDKFGDVIDVEFYDTLENALEDKEFLKGKYADEAVEWQFEIHTTWHESDGKLVDESYEELSW